MNLANTDGYIVNKTYNEIKIGDTASMENTLTLEDIKVFAVMSGDVSPEHVDPQYAKKEENHGLVGHGMWSGSLIAAVLETQLPGPGTFYDKQCFDFKAPIKIGDTITASVKVIEKNEDNRLKLDCKCTNQDGVVVLEGKAEVIAPTEKVNRKKMTMPEVTLRENGRFEQMIKDTEHLAPVRTAVVWAMDDVSLSGAVEAAKRTLITPVLVGSESEIRRVAKECDIDISSCEIVDAADEHKAVAVAVAMAASGEVETLMKGSLHTDHLMSAVVSRNGGLRAGRRLSHIFAMDVPTYHKPLYITDGAINIYPDLMVKMDIVQNAIDLARAVTPNITPKVAILSAVETVNVQIQSTIDATALCKMADRGQITGGILDGPLAFDNAVSAEAARIKNIQSKVAGDADILVAPNLEAGNMIAKQLTYLAEAQSAGIVLGAKVPIILTSRADSALSRTGSCAVAALYVYANRK